MLNNNFRNYLRQDVNEAIQQSLLEENHRDPMTALHEQVMNCFQPFIINNDSDNGNNSTRHLQQDLSVLLFNGVFVELSALLQFYYGWSTVRVDDGNNTMRDIQVQDVCFGAGPSAGEQ